MMTEYKKEDDYTLLATNILPSGGTLSRYFNFAAGQITTIFTQRADLTKQDHQSTYSGGGISVSVSTALTSQMSIQSFSSLDYTAELEQMHEILKKQGGHPPELDEQLTKKINKGSNKLP